MSLPGSRPAALRLDDEAAAAGVEGFVALLLAHKERAEEEAAERHALAFQRYLEALFDGSWYEEQEKAAAAAAAAAD